MCTFYVQSIALLEKSIVFDGNCLSSVYRRRIVMTSRHDDALFVRFQMLRNYSFTSKFIC